MESRQLLTSFVVTTTADSGPGSLRQAILQSDMPHSGADNIDFAIPASDPTTSPNLDVPVPGFDPVTQTWKITLNTPLPAITHQVTIDGFSQGHFPIPFRYPIQTDNQSLSILGNPTGGTFTLTTTAPLPVVTTAPIPFNATPAQVQAALTSVLGPGTVIASGGPSLPGSAITIAFAGRYAGLAVPALIANGSLTGGSAPLVVVTAGQLTDPSEIASSPNGLPISAAIDGNNATPRVIIEGGAIPRGSGGDPTGLVLDASNSSLRGLIVDGFGVGISVPNPADVGDLIQGNDVGKYRVFRVDPVTGFPQPGAAETGVIGQGNSLQGVLLASTNATVGGLEPQDNNVIIGNGLQGVSLLPGAEGNQVVGNQIGVIGPPGPQGVYFIVPNGSDGVLIAASSNYIGGPTPAAGNLISGNGGDGVHIVGPAATRNDIAGNYIGVGPGGGYLFGNGSTGNVGDGVTIDDASDNLIGGPSSGYRNVISGNAGAGVRISGDSGVRNTLRNNYIGLTADGVSALANGLEGVAIFSPLNVVGPANVISANLRGVLLSGLGATGNQVRDNLIGTDSTGKADLGNALEGVRIDGASGNTVVGDSKGSQVISGNNVGVVITGSTATNNLVQGTFVGTDITGTVDLGNSQEGILIENSSGNSIGGPVAADKNLISSNHWGVVITGVQARGNLVAGNSIGTGITGQETLGNELDGVLINSASSGNTIGGSLATAGNTIAFNRRDGVRVEDVSVNNAILSNQIFANLELGINLFVPPAQPGSRPNMLQAAPALTAIATSVSSTIIRGTLDSTPNTTFTIQFFFSSPLDPTGQGEGGIFVGQATAVTGADGTASYSANIPTILKSGQFVTATATDPLGNTSEFSAPLTEVFGTVQFQMASYIVDEGVGTATIVATRIGGSGGFFTVDYATSDGSAQAGSDYQPASGTLTFNPGQDTATFTITIIDDGLADADETVNLNLSNPTGPVTLGAQSTAVLTILGNQPGSFLFSMGNYFVDETAGTATITVARDRSGPAATVHYSTADGSAQAGTDYLPASGTLNFNAGQTLETFSIPILIDPLNQTNRTVILNLSSPTGGAALGVPSTALLTILGDNVDRMGPHVTSAKAVSGPFGVSAVVLTFDELLNPTTAVDLLNYGYSVRTAGRDGKLGTGDDKLIGLCPATYNPATRTVVLPLATAIPNGLRMEIQINVATDVPGAGVGVSDLSGNLLDGNFDGHPGGAYTAILTAQPAPKTRQAAAKSKGHAAKPVKHPAPAPKAKVVKAPHHR